MSSPPLSDQTILETVEAYREEGNNIASTARRLGLSPNATANRLKHAQARGLLLSRGARRAVENAELSPTEARRGWIRAKDPDSGLVATTYWDTKHDVPVEDVIERIRSALENMEAAPPIDPPALVMDRLLTVYPLMDVHFGMLAHVRETRVSSYDTNIALADMRRAMANVLAITPNAREAILLVGGDFFHANDNTSQTPKSRHNLDVDSRHWQVLERGVAFIAEVAEQIARKHERVTIRVLRGNHDAESHLVLTFAMAERYRLTDRITVDKSPADTFARQWGKCLIAAHHGDNRATPERMTLHLADNCPYWSETRHRVLLTGHVHHAQSKDTGALKWESLRAFCPPDSYAASQGYAARRALHAITYDAIKGEVLRATDPVEGDYSVPSPLAG
jgi:DNA-binding Lrp family transcriptional regulator